MESWVRSCVLRTCCLLLVCVGAVALAPLPAAAVGLSGGIEYVGNLGPVSAAKPIRIWVFDSPVSREVERVADTTVTTNGGSWSVELPHTGSYYLLYWLDADGNSEPSVDEPTEIYRDVFSLEAAQDPLQAPQTGVVLAFDDTWVLAGIRGTVTYTGSYPVRGKRPFIVTNFDNPDLSGSTFTADTTNGGPYAVLVLGENGYLRAHLDLDFDDEYDPGEPFVIHDGRSVPPADPVAPGSILDLVFGDENAPASVHISGTVEYAGSRGPVSASRPILIFLLPGPPSDWPRRTLTGNGSFDIAVPGPGTYSLIYALDVSGEGILVGAPFEVYQDRSALPADPIEAPAAGLRLEFDDSSRMPGIAGTLTYSGGLGPVSEDRRIILEGFNDAALTSISGTTEVSVNVGRYGLLNGALQAPLVYLRAYLDVDDDHAFDPGEPYGVCDAPVQSSPDQIDVAIRFGDGGGAATCALPSSPTPTVTSTRTRPPTATVTSTASRTGTPTITHTPTRTPTQKVTIPGDADCSGVVDRDDVGAMLSALFDPLARARCDADCNRDGQVSVADLACVVGKL